MSREKIDEIAELDNDIYNNYQHIAHRDSRNLAENLYNDGWRKQSGWISVEERLPDIEPHGKGRYGGARSVRVLCACKQREGRTLVKEGYYEPCGNGIVVWRIPRSIGSVTHWMPLPSPPDMKGGAE